MGEVSPEGRAFAAPKRFRPRRRVGGPRLLCTLPHHPSRAKGPNLPVKGRVEERCNADSARLLFSSIVQQGVDLVLADAFAFAGGAVQDQLLLPLLTGGFGFLIVRPIVAAAGRAHGVGEAGDP